MNADTNSAAYWYGEAARHLGQAITHNDAAIVHLDKAIMWNEIAITALGAVLVVCVIVNVFQLIWSRK